MIGYHTGARKGEIRLIRRDKIDLAARRIYLPGRTTKNGKPRYLPIYGNMAPELDMALSMGDPQCHFWFRIKGSRFRLREGMGNSLPSGQHSRGVIS